MTQPNLTITQTFASQSEAQRQQMIQQKVNAYLNAKQERA